MYTSINLPTYCIQSFRHTMLIFTHAVLEKCDWSHTRSLAPNAFASSHSVSLLLTTTATFISLTHSPHSYSFDALYLLHSSPSTLKSLTVYSSWCWSFTLHSFTRVRFTVYAYRCLHRALHGDGCDGRLRCHRFLRSTHRRRVLKGGAQPRVQ